MSVGKYSPTVSAAYANDQKWWNRNGGEDPAKVDAPPTKHFYDDYFFDNDGYDSYGYNVEAIDRAGYTEDEYLGVSEWDQETEEYNHTLYDMVYDQWVANEDGFPEEK